MSEFRVKAGWPDGSVAEQSVMAADIGSARMEIERRGGHVFEVRRKGFVIGERKAAGRGRIKMSEFLIFNQEMIALLKAGLPIVRASYPARDATSPTRRRLLRRARRVTRTSSRASPPRSVPAPLGTSLKAGEKSGEIERCCGDLKYPKT